MVVVGGGRMKGWARQTEWQEGGDEGGIESVKVWKESHVCISACVKGSKRRNPASDLIWAWMQTTPKAQPLQGAACTESVCVFVFVHAGVGAAEGLVAREILTYRAPLPAALSLASTSRRKRSAAARLIYNLSLLFFPTCLSLFLLPLSSFVCIKVIWFSAKNAYWSLY